MYKYTRAETTSTDNSEEPLILGYRIWDLPRCVLACNELSLFEKFVIK